MIFERPSWTQKVCFTANFTAFYLLTLAFIGYIIFPVSPFARVQTAALTQVQQPYVPPARTKMTVVAGRPVRIVIPGSGVDLPVDEGFYNGADDSWTLSGYRAQFAMISTLANNIGGETYIYGHNNDYVFGALRHHTPAIGAQALVYTDNGHIFAYQFESVTSLGPGTTSVLNYSGPPILMVQTCTGSLNEWRTEYKFAFDKVVQ